MRTMFANIYYIYPLFSQMVSHDMLLSMINSNFCLETICNAVWRMFANIYLFLPLTLSNGVKGDVIQYDEFRFQREIICNVVCEECFEISIYTYRLFYQMVSHDMLLGMINSDFSQKSFVMLYANNVCKIYSCLPLIFSNGVTRHVVEYDKLQFLLENL